MSDKYTVVFCNFFFLHCFFSSSFSMSILCHVLQFKKYSYSWRVMVIYSFLLFNQSFLLFLFLHHITFASIFFFNLCPFFQLYQYFLFLFLFFLIHSVKIFMLSYSLFQSLFNLPWSFELSLTFFKGWFTCNSVTISLKFQIFLYGFDLLTITFHVCTYFHESQDCELWIYFNRSSLSQRISIVVFTLKKLDCRVIGTIQKKQ